MCFYREPADLSKAIETLDTAPGVEEGLYLR